MQVLAGSPGLTRRLHSNTCNRLTSLKPRCARGSCSRHLHVQVRATAPSSSVLPAGNGAAPSPSPLAATSYQRASSRIHDLANRLRELGVVSELQLPTLVTAGDQSSGKSSVVEAIAGVALPRADGTCTRCPTEVRMTAEAKGGSGGWSCVLKLSRSHDSDGAPLLERPPEELFAVVNRKDHIAACVTAAQSVLLNPGKVAANPQGVRAYVPDLSGKAPRDTPALKALGSAGSFELGFTHNRVVLEISGAEADLTIIDLPGVIHNHTEGKRYVDLVERMTREHLAPPHHIIAMTLPAGLDPETQAIRLWAREADPEGLRTIGIVTKPDTIPSEQHLSHERVIRLVKQGGLPPSTLTSSSPAAALGGAGVGVSAAGGRVAGAGGGGGGVGGGGGLPASGVDREGLRLGYYVVRNPPQEQVEEGITFEEARAAERAFFHASPHWSKAVGASPHLASRLGADHLRDGLSALLVDQIQKQLPAMRRRAKEQLDAIAEQLRGLPPPPESSPLHELHQLLASAAEALHGELEGTSAHSKATYQQLRRLYKAFGDKVITSTPAFLVKTTLISALNDEDKGLDSGSQQQGDVTEGSLDLKPYLGGKTQPEDVAAVMREAGELKKALAGLCFPTDFMTLQQVAELRAGHMGRELPTFSPYSAMEELLSSSKGRWGKHACSCLAEVVCVVQERTEELVQQHFRRYPKAAAAVGAALAAHMEALADKTAVELAVLVGIEDIESFTLNDHYFRSQEGIFRSRLKKAYADVPTPDESSMSIIKQALGQLQSYGKLSFKSYDQLFMAHPTPVDDELHMMAACLAYYKVAFKRFQDGVPLRIRDSLLRRLARRDELVECIMEGLVAGAGGGGGGGDVDDVELKAAAARELLAEDPQLAARRTQLRDSERRLREALALLSGYSAAGVSAAKRKAHDVAGA